MHIRCMIGSSSLHLLTRSSQCQLAMAAALPSSPTVVQILAISTLHLSAVVASAQPDRAFSSVNPTGCKFDTSAPRSLFSTPLINEGRGVARQSLLPVSSVLAWRT